MKLGLRRASGGASATVPSADSIRTSTSVSVASSPSIAIVLPRQRRAHRSSPAVLDESVVGLHR